MITIHDIKSHPSQTKIAGIFKTIKQLIDGRIPHDNMTILYVLREMLAERCQTYLEIGVHNGGSMSVVMQSKHPCRFYGIDMFEKVLQNPRLEYFAADHLSFQKTFNNIKKCNIHNHNFVIIEGNSRSQKVIDQTRDIGDVDLFFIDGDHSYMGIKADFDNYSSLVSSGGILVIDDYHKGHPDIIKFVDRLADPRWHKIGAIANSFIMQRIISTDE